ncbi:MAG: hypothetical protein ACI89L_002493 [Phycisphaerales bacterium]|jgi:hypothetical protein
MLINEARRSLLALLALLVISTAAQSATAQDSDGDGLDDFSEQFIFGTNPNDPDTDNDFLNDGQEVLVYTTDPLNPATDGDGLPDGVEVFSVGTDPLNPADDTPPPLCGFVNHSFEASDFFGWVTQDLLTPFYPLSVTLFDTNIAGWDWDSNPTNGILTAFHGFDGDGAASGFPISIAQDIIVSNAALTFHWRAAWDNLGALDRTFDVVIRPTGGGSELARFNVLTAAAGTANPDSGQRAWAIDLSAFLGLAVRVSFEWTIPEDFTGAGQFKLDNICLVPLEPCGFVNPSFETGDFTGWMAHDLTSPFSPLGVTPGGDNPLGAPWSTAPTEGSFTAVHGFDGNGATSGRPIRMMQRVPVLQPSLSFDWRAAWDIPNAASLDRTFDVVVRTLGGITELLRQNVLTAAGGTFNPDTGEVSSTIDLSAFMNTIVDINFEWNVPEDFTGPGMFQFDNVCLGPVPCPADTNGDGILDNGDIITFVSLFLASDITADMNGDGILDNGDIITFVSLFLAGC